MEQCTRRWGPYSSIASLYMLRVADNERTAIFLPEDQALADRVPRVIDVEDIMSDEGDIPRKPKSRKRLVKGLDGEISQCAASNLAKFGVNLNSSSVGSRENRSSFGIKLNSTCSSALDI